MRERACRWEGREREGERRFPEGKHNIHLRYADEFNAQVAAWLAYKDQIAKRKFSCPNMAPQYGASLLEDAKNICAS